MAQSEQICGRCGHDFCRECVVFPFGLRKPPMCIACALEAGGVRHQHTGRPKLAQGEVKRRLKHLTDEPEPEAEPAPEPAGEKPDDGWLTGDVDPQVAGGWSKKY